MVKYVILSRDLQPKVTLAVGSSRKIDVGPLYLIDEILTACESTNVRILTKKAIRDVQNLSLCDEQVTQLIQRAVQGGRYKNSEWCELGRTDTTVSWAACDAYTLKLDEWNEAAGKFFPTEYYLKFAIGKTGLMLLVVSCHL